MSVLIAKNRFGLKHALLNVNGQQSERIDLQFSLHSRGTNILFVASQSHIQLINFISQLSFLASQLLHRVSHFQSIKGVQWCWRFFSIFQFFSFLSAKGFFYEHHHYGPEMIKC